jgi:hypothetical protein
MQIDWVAGLNLFWPCTLNVAPRHAVNWVACVSANLRPTPLPSPIFSRDAHRSSAVHPFDRFSCLGPS